MVGAIAAERGVWLIRSDWKVHRNRQAIAREPQKETEVSNTSAREGVVNINGKECLARTSQTVVAASPPVRNQWESKIS